MKCFLTSILLVVALLGATTQVSAEIDLSELSFDDLIQLRQDVNDALFTSPEWESVTVPQGVYQVGVDIPACHWTLNAVENDYTAVYYCEKLDEHGLMYGRGYCASYVLSNTPAKGNIGIDIDMEEGMYIIIERSVAVFTPYTGARDLGFKK